MWAIVVPPPEMSMATRIGLDIFSSNEFSCSGASQDTLETTYNNNICPLQQRGKLFLEKTILVLVETHSLKNLWEPSGTIHLNQPVFLSTILFHRVG